MRKSSNSLQSATNLRVVDSNVPAWGDPKTSKGRPSGLLLFTCTESIDTYHAWALDYMSMEVKGKSDMSPPVTQPTAGELKKTRKRAASAATDEVGKWDPMHWILARRFYSFPQVSKTTSTTMSRSITSRLHYHCHERKRRLRSRRMPLFPGHQSPPVCLRAAPLISSLRQHSECLQFNDSPPLSSILMHQTLNLRMVCELFGN